jgi:phenylacetate-CoA ligase
VLNLAEHFARQGLDARKTSLKLGMFGAEPWTEAMRIEIEQRLDIDAVDLYGLSEVMGPGVASECVESKDGPVIWEDHFYPEIIDPETSAVRADGETGELVFTSLTKQALPLIRYRTRDLTKLLPPTSRSMRRMARVTGRADDMLIIRGVNVFPSQIEELILGNSCLAPHYLLEISRSGALDQLTVKVEAHPSIIHNAAACEQAGADLQHNIKSYIGVTALVSVCSPGSVERSVGKAKRILDLRGR